MHEEIVDYETGMLLKKCGFDECCNEFYYNDIQHNGKSISFDEQLDLVDEGRGNEIVEIKGGSIGSHWNRNSEDWLQESCCSAPSLTLVEKSLREKYKILIQIGHTIEGDDIWYSYSVTSVYDKCCTNINLRCSKYEEAKSNAIKFALNHYILSNAI